MWGFDSKDVQVSDEKILCIIIPFLMIYNSNKMKYFLLIAGPSFNDVCII